MDIQTRLLKVMVALTLSITTVAGFANTSSFSSIPLSNFSSSLLQYAQAKEVGNPLVYHLSSDEPWRATVAISDATTMLKLGHNVTLLLSIEGVQIGV